MFSIFHEIKEIFARITEIRDMWYIGTPKSVVLVCFERARRRTRKISKCETGNSAIRGRDTLGTIWGSRTFHDQIRQATPETHCRINPCLYERTCNKPAFPSTGFDENGSARHDLHLSVLNFAGHNSNHAGRRCLVRWLDAPNMRLEEGRQISQVGLLEEATWGNPGKIGNPRYKGIAGAAA